MSAMTLHQTKIRHVSTPKLTHARAQIVRQNKYEMLRAIWAERTQAPKESLTNERCVRAKSDRPRNINPRPND